jgi:hypothetical protein
MNINTNFIRNPQKSPQHLNLNTAQFLTYPDDTPGMAARQQLL